MSFYINVLTTVTVTYVVLFKSLLIHFLSITTVVISKFTKNYKYGTNFTIPAIHLGLAFHQNSFLPLYLTLLTTPYTLNKLYKQQTTFSKTILLNKRYRDTKMLR